MYTCEDERDEAKSSSGVYTIERIVYYLSREKKKRERDMWKKAKHDV